MEHNQFAKLGPSYDDGSIPFFSVNWTWANWMATCFGNKSRKGNTGSSPVVQIYCG